MNEEIVHVRLLNGIAKMLHINLCEWGWNNIEIRLPKESQMINITCEDCTERWKEERE